MTRAEKVAEAQRLRGEGLLLREIAERMGSKTGTVHSWLADPDLSKQRARREGYRGTCVDCGKPTDGSNGAAKAPTRCSACTSTHNGRWGKTGVVEAIQRFADRYGRPPSATDFNPHHALKLGHSWRAERFYADADYPYTANVLYQFGTWNTAVEAAGFATRRVGEYNRMPGRRGRAELERERHAA
jgi:hypothetical protein